MAATQGFKVLLLLLVSWCGAEGHAVNVTRKEPRELPCPESLDILPCVCTVNPDYSMDMDCSTVESEQQLSQIFNQHFDFVNFHMLTIEFNYNLNVLREGALGECTFEEIEMHYTSLATVESGALAKSFATARRLTFYSSYISYFPFEEIQSFEHLQQLDLSYNNIFGFPYVRSPTLEYLYLSGNPITDLPTTAFSGTTSLRAIGLGSAQLTRIFPGMFLVTFGAEKTSSYFHT